MIFMLTFTHMFVALALAYIFRLPKLPAFLAALAVDLDIVFNILGLGFPFVHRGIIHTPLFLVALTAIWYYGRNRSKTGLSFGVGGLSHVMLDFVTNRGVPLLFPLAAFLVVPMVDYANLVANSGITLLSIAVVLLYHYSPEWIGVQKKGGRRKEAKQALLVFLAFVAIIIVILAVAGFFPFPVFDPFVGLY